ncbi:MAG: YceI family protein [Pseudomonas sp.]|uniref:YceI family protein n=1 Tax=Pseudomonas sp. TaxID=306 RepID=UPI003C76776E
MNQQSRSFILASLFGLFLTSAATSAAAADTYTLDPAHTQTIFTINHLGFSTVTGSMRDLKGTLLLDSQQPENSSVTVTMNPNNVDTGFAARDADLRSPTFFNTAQFPTMTFKSTRVTKTGDKTSDVQGDFTMLGVTRPVTLKVILNRIAQDTVGTNVYKVGFTGTTAIKRSDFGMKAYLPYVGDDVSITINFEGIKQ